MIDLSPLVAFTGTARDCTVISLRPMLAGDEPAFRDLYAEVRASELQQVPWPTEAKRAFCDSQYSLQDKHYRAHYAQFSPLAVCLGNQVIGRLYIGEFDRALVLMDIIIAGQYRGRGIGTLLIEAVTAHADAKQVELRLHVEPLNPVRRLYARLGFVDSGAPGIYQQMVRSAAAGPAA